ncbi:transglutaminase 5, like [Brienomyrus brachyistius]|uniref:transglutaminase 5, like n=1 Tax=Brienomyrus brachyistius TaxID=42636 RepID=UPI0020B3CAA7|nr:transglutaminase 5, like [Brienomyrus brachyistius]
MKALCVSYVNWNLVGNQEDHKSQGLSSKHLVVRRGKPFRITLFFKDEPFDPRMESLTFKALLGELCIEIPATFSQPTTDSTWGAQIELGKTVYHSVTVQISTSSRAPVGLYNLQLNIQSQFGLQSCILGGFILLFNPWCRADRVFLPSEAQRQEYVKNDIGILFMGTSDNVQSRSWDFGLYEQGILDICLKILDISPQHSKNKKNDYLRRSDPVYLSRVVCAMINCEDDKGVLKGNWSGDFSKGVPPSQWTGSATILKLWDKTQFSPVLFGQCWVFASVMCTVMRVLGIPTRVVTNFNSAHDTDGNLSVEEYYSETGEKLPQTADSIWNYHLWVECWMTRPDIGVGFDGWQALDPTPQERSDGIYCCGPCPVKAVREKQVDLFYDVPFIYAEVNADVHTAVVRNGKVLVWNVDTDRVGSLICTKCVDSSFPQDITNTYKKAKDNMSSAGSNCGSVTSRPSANTQRQRQTLDVSLKLSKVPVAGENINFSVTVTNKANFTRIVGEQVNAQVKEYNRSPVETFWEASQRLKLAPREVAVIHHSIPYVQAMQFLLGDNLVNLAVVLSDEVTMERALAYEEIKVSTPQISIQIDDEDGVLVNTAHTVLLSFRNFFPVAVTGVLRVSGPGLTQEEDTSKVYLLKAGETRQQAITICPKTAGAKMLQASLKLSNNHTVLRGFKTISVNAA